MLANPSLFLIRIHIGLCSLSQIDLVKKTVCSLYSMLGSRTLLLIYTSWLVDALFHLIALHILFISFLIIFKLQILLFLFEIQTPKYLAKSESFFVKTLLYNLYIIIVKVSFSFLSLRLLFIMFNSNFLLLILIFHLI